MNTKHTPQVGDIWTVEESRGNWKCIWEHHDNQEIKVFMLCESGAAELLGTGAFKTDCAGASTPARLIERDGLRGEELWSEWTWSECPKYRKEQVRKAWEDGYVVETRYLRQWARIHRSVDEPFDSRLGNAQPYRIIDRKRVGFNTRVCQGCGKLDSACLCNAPDPDDAPDPDKFPGLTFQQIDWHKDKEGCIWHNEILRSMQECINQRDFAGWYYPQQGGQINSEVALYDDGETAWNRWRGGCTVVRPTHAAFVKGVK